MDFFSKNLKHGRFKMVAAVHQKFMIRFRQCIQHAFELNERSTLILDQNTSAFYLHCFAYRLQLALRSAGKSHINDFGFLRMKMQYISLYEHRARGPTKFWNAQAVELRQGIALMKKSRRDVAWIRNVYCDAPAKLVGVTFGSIVKVHQFIFCGNGSPRAFDRSATPKYQGEASRFKENAVCRFQMYICFTSWKRFCSVTSHFSETLQHKEYLYTQCFGFCCHQNTASCDTLGRQMDHFDERPWGVLLQIWDWNAIYRQRT